MAPERPTEESEVPTAVMDLYNSFTSVSHPTMLSQTESGESGGGAGDSVREENDGASENVGNVPARGSTAEGRYRPCRARRTSKPARSPWSSAKRTTPLLDR